MEASKVYYTDFRCPVGTSLLDKLRRVCIAAGDVLFCVPKENQKSTRYFRGAGGTN